jgi:hypothetical protein
MERRTIQFKGKRNIDAVSGQKPRRSSLPDGLDVDSISEAEQISFANKLFLGEDFEHSECIRSGLMSKLRAYKSQDRRNSVYDVEHFVSMERLVELLVTSRLRCCHCSSFVPLLYDKPNDRSQWTLDRVCNDQGHNDKNVRVACLGCNVRRGDMNIEKFQAGRIVKVTKK